MHRFGPSKLLQTRAGLSMTTRGPRGTLATAAYNEWGKYQSEGQQHVGLLELTGFVEAS